MSGLKLFVDTMMFLHFRPLGELKLLELFGVDSITVVVPSITIKELDKHKSTHPSKKVRERALRAVRGFETGFASQSASIAAELFWSHPKAEIEANEMNSESADEVLVASMLAYQIKHPNENIALLTDDAFPRLLCKQHGMTAKCVDESFRWVEDVDPVEAEIRELKRQLQRLTNAMPKLEVFFSSTLGKAVAAHFRPNKFVPRSQDVFQDERNKLQRRYPKMHPLPTMVNPTTLSERISQSQNMQLQRISEADRIAYGDQIDRFIDNSIKWMQLSDSVKSIHSRLLRPELSIFNSGTAPANDISVTITFHASVKVLSEANIPEVGNPPQPPDNPLSRYDLHRESFSDGLPDIERFNVGSEPPVTTEIRVEQGIYSVIQHMERLKHGMDAELFTDIFVLLPPLEDARSFQCDYQIRVGNLPDPITGELHFVIDRE